MSFRILRSLVNRNSVTFLVRQQSTASTSITSSSSAVEQHTDEPIDIPNPFKKERTECILCRLNITPNYKNVKLLSQFQSPYTGRIYGRHITGLCKMRQEQVEREIAKAQVGALMPTYHKSVEFLKDPRLFDPERPIRPHKY